MIVALRRRTIMDLFVPCVPPLLAFPCKEQRHPRSGSPKGSPYTVSTEAANQQGITRAYHREDSPIDPEDISSVVNLELLHVRRWGRIPEQLDTVGAYVHGRDSCSIRFGGIDGLPAHRAGRGGVHEVTLCMRFANKQAK